MNRQLFKGGLSDLFGGSSVSATRRVAMMAVAYVVIASLLASVAYGGPDYITLNPEPQFVWMGGDNNPDINYPGDIGLVGTPPGRFFSCSVPDEDGNVWIFGGVNSHFNNLNDLWKYNPHTKEWRWYGGSTDPEQSAMGDYPEGLNQQGWPGSRFAHGCWIINKKLYVYGGGAWDEAYYADTWVYDIQAGTWKIISGLDRFNGYEMFYLPGTVGDSGFPGGRYEFVSWAKKDGTGFFIYGGYGDIPGNGDRNDVWFYDIAAATWYWKGGDDEVYWDFNDNWPTPGDTSSTLRPTTRYGSGYCRDDATGNMYLWGGIYVGLDKKRGDKEQHKKDGKGSAEDPLERAKSHAEKAKNKKRDPDFNLNDLWMWNDATSQWVYLNHWNPSAGDFPGELIVGLGGVPPIRETGLMWCDIANNKLWLTAGLEDFPANDLWVLDMTRGRWYFAGGSDQFLPSLEFPENIGDVGVPGGRIYGQNFKAKDGKMYFYGGWLSDDNMGSDLWYVGQPAGPEITSYTPNPIPIVGGLVTVVGTKFNFGESSVATLTSLVEGRQVHKHPILLWSDGTTAALIMPPATGKDNTLCIDNVCAQVNYAIHFVNSMRTYPFWTPFVEITGGNFNPNSVRVELLQQSTTPPKQPTGKPQPLNPNLGNNFAPPLCEVLNATTDTIVCSVININPKGANSLKAVVYVNDVPIAAKMVAKLIDDTTSSCIPPRGSPDIWATDYCNCWSGYAPSTSESTDCDVRATCAEKLLDAEDTFAGNSPSAPSHSFMKDTLYIKQTIPIGLKRRSFWVNFRVPHLNNSLPLLPGGSDGAATCRYPGPLWTKTVDQLDCYDVLTATMPWSQNKFCGFVQDLDASTVEWAIYKSTMVTKFVEVYNVDGALYQRISSFSYLITVKFLTQKRIQSSDLAVWMADSTEIGFVKVKVNSDAVYDVASNMIYVTFSTTADWPYMLNKENSSFVNVVPAHEGVTVEIVNVEGQAEVNCDITQDSVCEQKWFIRVNSNGICDIGGTYTFASSVLCRDVNSTSDPQSCPEWATPVQFSMRMAKTDLCAPAALEATAKLTAELIPYFDADHNEPSDTYQTGDMIFWKVNVNNPQGTIDRIEFEEIEMSLMNADEGDSSSVDIMFHSGMTTQQGAAAELVTRDVTTSVAPGEPATLYMNHRVLRNALVNTVGKLSSTDQAQNGLFAVDLRTSVTLTFYFHGNDKRAQQKVPLTVAAQRHITIVPTRKDDADKSVSNFEVSELPSAAPSFTSASHIIFSILVSVVVVVVCSL